MKIAIIGSGYVGLVSGACFSEYGNEVFCVDKDKKKVKALKLGKIPIYEPGLEEIVKKNVKKGRLFFTTDITESVPGAQAIFIAVGTPTSRRGDGYADLSYVYTAAKEIAPHLKNYAVVVNKSTVPVGTAEQVKRIIKEKNPKADFDVASNPEFLREGAAISDFMYPDRVVIGVDSKKAEKVLTKLYRPIDEIERPVVVSGIRTAELIKYASNAFLAAKISFINEIANLCEAVGADVADLARGMGLDSRIGPKFLQPGPGYGGILLS
jgi:UDPglucose 6-dehydrogenase